MPSRLIASLLLALAFLSSARLVAQTPAWTQFPTSPSVSRHDDISPVNEMIAYTGSGLAGIYKTTDGGKTWTQKAAGFSGTHFRCIGFADALHGWAGNLGAGSYDNGVTDTNNILYETFDGGNTWTNRPGFYEAGMKGLCSLHVFDPQTIYGVGRVRGPAYFIKSTDAGTNWTIVSLEGVMGGLMDVYFKDKTNGFVVGMDTNSFYTATYHGAIAATTNGGLSWQMVASTTYPNCYFWKMSWPTPDIGYVSLQKNPFSSDAIVFYKTTDGGTTWASNGIPISAIGISSFYWQGIGFVSPTEGWAGGDGSTSPYANNFLHTIDGGASWSRVGYNDSRRINRVRVLSPTLAFASGTRVHVFRIPLTNAIPPHSLTNSIGSSATFTVTSYGTAPLAYQWRFGGTNLAGATTNSYTIFNVQATNAGNYTVVVSDYSGSITSVPATLTVIGVAISPTIVAQPQSQIVSPGSNAPFTVTATGTIPLSYQWRFNGTNLSGETQTSYVRTNTQAADLGGYSVVVTNIAGSVTSSVATLAFGFTDDFDGYPSPSIVTAAATTNGYKIFFRALSGAMDFKAIFGFDYSTVIYPTNIPPAPHSVGGTTRGLFLTVNKDGDGQPAAVNLYPTNQSFSGNFALKFDLWINWRSLTTSTEHALFGINHSGNVTNRIGVSPSDGLFFAVEGEADSPPTSPTLRDYSVFRGASGGAPILMITNNTTFGPTPLLGPQFDNDDPGFVALFPSKTIPDFRTTPAGTAGLGWLTGEVRQKNNLITWLLNETAIAQYTNTYAYTNGNILIGYDDNFPSPGDSNNFAIFDNIRVETIVSSPPDIVSPRIEGNNFTFSFATERYETYTVQQTTNVISPVWVNFTNFLGNGNINDVLVPLLPDNPIQQYFRVSQP